MESKIKFLSIDPSLAHTAIVVGELVDGEINLINWIQIDTEKSKEKSVRSSSDLVSRCSEIYSKVQEVVNQENAKIIFVETPSGSQSYSGALSYAISCYTIATINPSPIQVTPIEVKKLTIGTKTASKVEIINYVHKKFPKFLKTDKNGNPYKNMEHVADAVCIAEAGLKTKIFNQIKSLI
jgi:Holliday junction resolvasome RuvABC endonuclease subunit